MIAEYTIIESLGQGGFSNIYKAKDARGKLVVLKFPMTALIGDVATYERLQREFNIEQKMNHPAIPHAIAMNESPTGPYLVVEYIEGVSLRHYISEHGSLQLEEALSIGCQLADALAFLHVRGVYHRDLKPENIIVGTDDHVHILDFGIALMEGARRVTWSVLSDAMGTPDYMAPEQIQGKRGDARTDIYALGVILYEMLTGRVPFSGENSLSVMNQHMTATPVPPSRIKPSIPPGVEAVVLKCIRRNPDERYQAADLLEYDLKHFTELDLTKFAFGEQKKERAMLTDRQIWMTTGVAAIVFLLAAILVVLISILARK
jgi:serine/threonine-protein kinase